MTSINSTPMLRERILLTFSKISTPYLILIALGFNLILSLTFAFIRHKFGYAINSNLLSFESIKEELLVVVLIAPFAETVIYQYWLVTLTLFLTERLLKKESIILAIIIPAICFGLSHTYNYFYIINTFLAALSINLFYIIVKQRNQQSFILTVVLHALYNLSVFGLKSLA